MPIDWQGQVVAAQASAQAAQNAYAGQTPSPDVFNLSQYANAGVGSSGFLDKAAFGSTTAQLGQVDSQLRQLNSFRGTSQFDDKAFQAASAQRTQLNSALLRNTLINTQGKGRTGDQQRILDNIQSGDPGFMSYLNTMGGTSGIDWSTFEKDSDDGKTGATAFLKGYSDYVAAQASTASDATAAKAQADLYANAQTNAANFASGQESQIKSAQEGYSDTLANFDEQIARQLGGIEGSGQALSRAYGGADAASMASGAASQAADVGARDRQATKSEAAGTLNDQLSKVFESAGSYNFDAANLNETQKLQVVSQASQGVINQIDLAIKNGEIDANGEEGKLGNLLKQYQNEQTSAQTKRGLFKQILQASIGALMAGTGAALSASGVGAAVGAPLIAGGAATVAGAARG